MGDVSIRDLGISDKEIDARRDQSPEIEDFRIEHGSASSGKEELEVQIEAIPREDETRVDQPAAASLQPLGSKVTDFKKNCS